MRPCFSRIPACFALLLGLLLALPPQARAEENPELQEMVDELRALTEKSREQRAADRWFQQALEDLVARYDWPWRKELLFEDFSDGNYTESPAWEVASGTFWIDPSLGLRSRVRPERQPPPETSSRERTSNENRDQDLGKALLGALLNQALKPEETGGEAEPQPRQEAPRDGPASIRVSAPITNAFSLETAFSMHNEPGREGHFEIALLQDPRGDFGYLLSVQSGDTGLLDLYRLRRGRGELVYGARLKADPGDGRVHELVWRQAADGQVQVFMDGEAAVHIRDRAFRDGYGWVQLTNRGGELGVRKVRILGTP